MDKNKIRLNGCQVTNEKYDAVGDLTSVLIKFGMLYLPLRGQDIDRLEIHDTGMKLLDDCEDTLKNYILDISDMEKDLEDTYKDVSQLFGVDLRSELFSFAMTDDIEWKQARYSVVKEKLNIREW
jgi:hypothetical protein